MGGRNLGPLAADGHDIGAIMRAGGWSKMSIAMRHLSFGQHNMCKFQ